MSDTATPKHILLLRSHMLRLSDHPALEKAAEGGAAVVPLFVWDEGVSRPLGGAARWWLYESLNRLSAQLQAIGSQLIVRRGSVAEVTAKLAREMEADGVFLTRAYCADGRREEEALHVALDGSVRLRRFGGMLLMEPEELRTGAGKPYQVFSPFWRALKEHYNPRSHSPAPKQLKAPQSWPASEDLEAVGILPKRHFWAEGFREVAEPGEAAAMAALEAFLENGLPLYKDKRDRPDIEATSRLAPHLRFGEISPHTIWQRVRAHISDTPADGGSGSQGEKRASLAACGEKFLSELAWRDFCAQLVFHNPDMAHMPLRENFLAFPWRIAGWDAKDLKISVKPHAGQQGESAAADEDFAAWALGQTGFPIVDAGMRELWQTGTMHNRVRMVVASFLVKDMLIDWRCGEAWFWDTLTDADPASNTANWQWVAGCGADAAPYFRIFNPTTQGEKFDPDGRYVRRFVPELAEMPSKYIHQPESAPLGVLKAAGVELGKTYPRPILDRSIARPRALAALEKTKTEKTNKD